MTLLHINESNKTLNIWSPNFVPNSSQVNVVSKYQLDIHNHDVKVALDKYPVIDGKELFDYFPPGLHSKGRVVLNK